MEPMEVLLLAALENSLSYSVNYKKNGISVSTTITSSGTGTLTIGSLGAGAYTEIQVTKNNCPSNILGPFNPD